MSDVVLWQIEKDLRRVEQSMLIDAAEIGRLESAAASCLARCAGAGTRAAVADLRRRLTVQRHLLHTGDIDASAHRISGVEALAVQGASTAMDPVALELHVPACLDGVDPRTWRSWRDAVRAGYSTRACLGRAQARGEGSLDDVLACEEALACILGAHPVSTVRVVTDAFIAWFAPASDPRVRAWQYLIGTTGATYATSDPRRAVLALPASAQAWMGYVDPSARVSTASAGEILVPARHPVDAADAMFPPLG